MKKLISVILVFGMLLSVSAGAFACKSAVKGTKLDAATLSKIQTLKNSFETEVAPLKEELKTLYTSLKTAKLANPIDAVAVKALKYRITALNDQIKAKSTVLNQTIENVKLVAKYGADAVAKMDTAKAAYEKDVAPLKEKLKTLYANCKTAKSANPVDKAAVKSIKAQIATVHSDIFTKQKALNEVLNRIISVAKYGEEAVVKMEAAKAAFEKDVAPLKEKLKTLNANLKAAKSTNPVDTAAVKAIKAQICSVNAEIMAKKKALNDTLKSIMYPAITNVA